MASMLLTPFAISGNYDLTLDNVFVHDIRALDTRTPYTYYELLMTHSNYRISWLYLNQSIQCICYVCSPYEAV